jgi:hypothetical protein
MRGDAYCTGSVYALDNFRYVQVKIPSPAIPGIILHTVYEEMPPICGNLHPAEDEKTRRHVDVFYGPGSLEGIMLGKADPIQSPLPREMDDALRFQVVIARVLAVTVEIDTHYRPLIS